MLSETQHTGESAKQMKDELNLFKQKFKSLESQFLIEKTNSQSKLENISTRMFSAELDNTFIPTTKSKLDTITKEIEQLRISQKQLLERSNNANDNAPQVNPYVQETKTKIDANTLLLFDSNGKFIKPNLLSKESTSQKIDCMTIDELTDMIPKYEIIQDPTKLLLNVGLNDLDNKSVAEVCSKYEEAVKVLTNKFKFAKIYLNSIFYRKDGSLKKETDELNHFISGLCDSTNNLNYINNYNINVHNNTDTKHIGRKNLHILLSNIKYVLFGQLPNTNMPKGPRNSRK